MTTPLTTHLQTLHHPLYTAATTHPFLSHAGRGTLPKCFVSSWLSQDRLYAQSYIRFIGALLSKIRLPPHNPDSARQASGTADHRAVDILIDALVNIRRELAFFEDVARRYALDLQALQPAVSCELNPNPNPNPDATYDNDRGLGTSSTGPRSGAAVRDCPPGAAPAAGGNARLNVDEGLEGGEAKIFGPNPITHAYIDLFISAGSSATSVLEGLVVLWATEVCYLRAWRFASSQGQDADAGPGTGPEKDGDGGALRKEFIPNWTSNDFETFVDRIGDIVDEMAGLVKGSEAREYYLGRCAVWWRQVLWLEGRFWPDVSSLPAVAS